MEASPNQYKAVMWQLSKFQKMGVGGYWLANTAATVDDRVQP